MSRRLIDQDETVPCEFCSRQTSYLGVAMCEPCLDLWCALLPFRTKELRKIPEMMLKKLKKRKR